MWRNDVMLDFENWNLIFGMVIDYRLLNIVAYWFKCVFKRSLIFCIIFQEKIFYYVVDLKSAFLNLNFRIRITKLVFLSELCNFQRTKYLFWAYTSTYCFHILISNCLNIIKRPNLQCLLNDIIFSYKN